MCETEINDELFTTAHMLSKNILDRLYIQRKVNGADDIELNYSSDYFRLKD